MNQRPASSEHDPYYERYISLVQGDDVLWTLRSQLVEMKSLLTALPPQKETFRYAEGKWSVRQLVGHVIDSERIFGYRALALARGEQASLPGFDEKVYMENAPFAEVPLSDLWKEFEALRTANILMLEKFRAEDWARIGIANDNRISTRAIAYVLAGHAQHHVQVLKERYL